MQFVKGKLNQLLHNDQVMRVIHTFYQAAAGALVAGLFAAHSTADVKGVLTVAVAAGLAAVKALFVSRKA